MLLFGETAFVLVLGEKWRMAGIIAMWMLPLYSLRFIASPLSYTFYIVDKQHVDLAWQVGLLVMTVATLNITSTSDRSEEHTSELQSLMRISYAVFCLKKKRKQY